MSRSSLLLSAVVFSLFSLTNQCQAQFGIGAAQTWLSSGARMNVSPVVTNSRRYARMNMSVGLSQITDVHTFSPVQGYPGLAPVNPIGFGFGGVGFDSSPIRTGRIGSSTPPPIRKSAAGRFVDAAWKFDKDKNARLNQDELEQLSLAVIAELKQTPAAYKKLQRGAQIGKKVGTSISEKDVTDAFLKQCLKYDRDQDKSLSPGETDVLAAALVRFLK